MNPSESRSGGDRGGSTTRGRYFFGHFFLVVAFSGFFFVGVLFFLGWFYGFRGEAGALGPVATARTDSLRKISSEIACAHRHHRFFVARQRTSDWCTVGHRDLSSEISTSIDMEDRKGCSSLFAAPIGRRKKTTSSKANRGSANRGTRPEAARSP